MARARILKTLRCTLIFAMLMILVVGVVFYKPPLKRITRDEIESLYGVGEVRLSQIEQFILQNQKAKVEDLRELKGVDDMIIDQLEKRFR